VVALSFLYLVFVRMLQLFRLRRCERDELAVEVVVLRLKWRSCAVKWRVRRCDQPVGCQNLITPLTCEFAGACRRSRCEF